MLWIGGFCKRKAIQFLSLLPIPIYLFIMIKRTCYRFASDLIMADVVTGIEDERYKNCSSFDKETCIPISRWMVRSENRELKEPYILMANMTNGNTSPHTLISLSLNLQPGFGLSVVLPMWTRKRNPLMLVSISSKNSGGFQSAKEINGK